MSENKIISLVTDKKAEDEAFGIKFTAEVKYTDDEVVLAKSSITVNGKTESSHIMVETKGD